MQTSVQHSEKSLEEQQADCQKALFDMISKVSNANRNHRKTETERKKVQSEYILAMKEKFVFCSLERSKVLCAFHMIPTWRTHSYCSIRGISSLKTFEQD
jgi:hypothetical protein